MSKIKVHHHTKPSHGVIANVLPIKYLAKQVSCPSPSLKKLFSETSFMWIDSVRLLCSSRPVLTVLCGNSIAMWLGGGIASRVVFFDGMAG